MKPLGYVQRTDRGYPLVRFADRDDRPCSIQASELALYARPGTSALWLGTDLERMHLDRAQVEALVAHLSAWLRTGSLEP